MKKIYFILLLSLVTFCSYSQKKFTLNEGDVAQKGYFTEIEYENIRGKVIVKSTLNGKVYRFIVDTGAPNVITKALFKELNPTVLSKIQAQDGNGKMDSITVVRLNEITLGNVVFNGVPALVSNDSFIFDCHHVDGFIGSNMLRNSIVQFSSKDHKMILTDQASKLPLNKKYASDLVVNLAQSSPYFKVKVKGEDKGIVELLFDLGMEGLYDLSLRHYSILEKEKIFTVLAKSKGSRVMSLNGIASDTTLYQLRLPELNVNGAILKNVSVQTTASSNSRIGSDLLKYGLVTLDYKNKKFYFDPFESSVDLYKKELPISITLKDNKMVIGVIWDQKLKDKVSPGDQVVAIDDIDYSNIDPCNLITRPSLFEGKDQFTLTLQGKDGVIKKVTINKG